jgi:Zinc-finger of the MIZ type in Nse subunit
VCVCVSSDLLRGYYCDVHVFHETDIPLPSPPLPSPFSSFSLSLSPPPSIPSALQQADDFVNILRTFQEVETYFARKNQLLHDCQRQAEQQLQFSADPERRERQRGGAYDLEDAQLLDHDWKSYVAERTEALSAVVDEKLQQRQADAVRSLEREVWNVNHSGEVMPGDEDEDIIEAGAVVSDTCPLTMEELQDPVKCQQCNHTYSRAAIVNYIGRRHGRECPVAACHVVVSVSQLVPDREAIVRLKNKRQHAKDEPMEDADEWDATQN